MDLTEPPSEDPRQLTLDQLRELRSRLQEEDDVVSYVRRVAQARVDIVRAERHRRERGESSEDLSSELRVVLSGHLTGGAPRPPRPVENLDDDRMIRSLDELCAEHGFSKLESADAESLDGLEAALVEFERGISDDRKERHERLDRLSAELVRRYREGEASVDGLLGS